MITIKIVVLLLAFVTSSGVFSAKILGIFPVASRSHQHLYSPLMRELVNRGHDVTVISPFEEAATFKNGTYRTIFLSGFAERLQEQLAAINPYEMFETNSVINSIVTSYILSELTEETLAHENVQELINSKEKFDLVISLEAVNHALKALASHFGAPLVAFSTLRSSIWTNLLVGNPAPPSYVPDLFSGYNEEMTFFERVKNSFLYVGTQLYFHYYLNPKNEYIMKKYIPGGETLNLNDIMYNISLVLLNSHPSINQPVPLVPNMVEIGGFHIKPPQKLPSDLQNFLATASNGVIYFSMGSNLKSSQFPPRIRDAFLETFSKLKERILWKWEEDVLPGRTPNVKLGKWFPQNDILAHPNVKLFITHGGLLSTIETVYHGVPIFAIPVLGDQKLNAKFASHYGIGLTLSPKEINKESVSATIEELLSNPKYRSNAKTRSRYFHDRVVSPMDTAIYWIEYVIRHKGAPHLRVAGVDLPWYKYLVLDVLVFVAISSCFVAGACYLTCTKIVCGRRNKIKIKTK